jgi:polar amino acid transport system permease protein
VAASTKRLLHFLLALLLFAAVIYFSLHELAVNWAPVWGYRQKFLQGWLLTLALSAAALVCSTAFGVLLAIGRRCPWLFVRDVCWIYVELIRGTPLLVQILVLFYGVFDQIGITDRFTAGVLILSGFSGAYISEIVRAGIESVAASQWESARAIGLAPLQIYRYVIAPQAIRQSLPPLAGQFASLVKNSSLLSIIGISELTLNAQEVNTYTFSALESYVPLALGYLILTLPISLWTQSLERKLRFET